MSEDIVLRLRGLPWSTTEEEIVKFFDPVEPAGGVDGVHITMSRDGRPSGEAYVELANQDDLPEAEKKHNQHIGRRYVEVFRARRGEMERALNRGKFQDNKDECCVRLQGLPYGCSKEEILQFFSGLEVVPNGIAQPTDYQGRTTGEAFVQFVDKETAERAHEKHKEKIAHRYIEIFKSNMAEVRAAMFPRMRGGGPYGGPMGGFNNRPAPYDSRDRYGGPNRYTMGGRGRYDDFDSYDGNGFNDGWGGRNRMSAPGGGGGGGMKPFRGGREGGHCVHMRGLPFKASEMDIADFFRPLNPINICIVKDHTGRPSGEADIEFACHEDAVRAMSRDKANMQHRYIELFLNSSPGGGGMARSGGFGGGYRDGPRMGVGGGRYGGRY
ncbi:RNA recognition motif domain [Trinorchestia longiramus]|nr:RNA recognition motif domain [Trinorchestia longiramus]